MTVNSIRSLRQGKPSHSPGTNGTNPGEGPFLLQDIGGLPLYALIIAVAVAIIITLLIIYLIHKYNTRHKVSHCKLPVTYRDIY